MFSLEFRCKKRDLVGEITEQQQLNLFMISYEEARKDVGRICKSRWEIKKYHTNQNILPIQAWDNIPDKIKELLIDLRYRGDYSKRTRGYIQKLAYDGDVKGFEKVLVDRNVWFIVPKDRFKRRIDFYENN